MKARCYKIRDFDWYRTKEIAGNIAQSIASSSALATGA